MDKKDKKIKELQDEYDKHEAIVKCEDNQMEKFDGGHIQVVGDNNG